MKQLNLAVFIFYLTNTRDPFFLRKPHHKSLYVLKGTLIGTIPIACIEYKGQLYNNVGVHDTIGNGVITDIQCGKVQLKYTNGRSEVLQLDADKKCGG
jgi:hypothetical protein